MLYIGVAWVNCSEGPNTCYLYKPNIEMAEIFNWIFNWAGKENFEMKQSIEHVIRIEKGAGGGLVYG